MPDLNEQMRAELDELVRDLYNFQGGSQFATRLEKIARRQHGSAAQAVASAIHYPACWDTAAYPTVESALSEVYAHYKCSECAPPVADAPIKTWQERMNEYYAHGTQNGESVKGVVHFKDAEIADLRAALSRRPAAEQEVEIVEGFFAGCKVYVDSTLPPDTVEYRSANRVRCNLKTGETTVIAAEQPAEELTPKDVNVLRRWAEQIERMASLFDDERGLLCQQVAVLMHRIAYKPAEAAGNALTDEHRTAVRDALADALGEAYDCTRVWSAWGVGTMGPDDFVLVAEDDERLDELTNAAISAVIAINMSQHSLRAAPQAAQGKGLTRDQIRSIFMAHGFTIKEGQTDLKDYVYAAADALLAAHTRASDGKDGERLDFMLENFARCSSLDMSGNHAWSGVGRFIGRGTTPREAIDAAIAAKGAEQSGGAK